MIDLFPNETVFVQWVIFMAALLVLNFGIFGPVQKILGERKSRTDGARERARLLDKTSQERALSIERKIEEARTAGNKQRMAIRRIGEKTAEEFLKKTRAEMDRKMEFVRQGVEKETKEASLQLRQYAQDLSRDLAAKVLGREL